MYYAVKLYKQTPVSGLAGFIGAVGEVSDSIDESGEGRVFVEGEYWDAKSSIPIEKGSKVKVVAVDGMVVQVVSV